VEPIDSEILTWAGPRPLLPPTGWLLSVTEIVSRRTFAHADERTSWWFGVQLGWGDAVSRNRLTSWLKSSGASTELT
jgi:hypothetical protein